MLPSSAIILDASFRENIWLQLTDVMYTDGIGIYLAIYNAMHLILYNYNLVI